MKHNKIKAILSVIGMAALIMDGKTAVTGGKDGIGICLQSLIPSIFPFLILSSLLLNSLPGRSPFVLRILEKICRMPTGSGIYLLIGFLGGYPVGAANVGDACHKGILSESDARRMISFCSNAGPAFIFGILSPMFSHLWACWLLWMIHIGSAILTGMILPGNPGLDIKNRTVSTLSLPKALESSVKVMGIICGWVILFRILLTYLNKWILGYFPKAVNVTITGIIELANGCLNLNSIADHGLRFFTASILLSFGGLCVAMQTETVSGNIPISDYLKGKLIQSAASGLLAYPVARIMGHVPCQYLLITVPGIVCMAILRSTGKKSSSIPGIIGV